MQRHTQQAIRICQKSPRHALASAWYYRLHEEYHFLRKGLVDRNKLLAVIMVSLCLPNYFVYYLWSFPDMMLGPSMKSSSNSHDQGTADANELSRKRCHAVISAMVDMEKGARVAFWSAKINHFGRKATERSIARLGNLVNDGCSLMTTEERGKGATSSHNNSHGGGSPDCHRYCILRPHLRGEGRVYSTAKSCQGRLSRD
jgi:hypothetical protein